MIKNELYLSLRVQSAQENSVEECQTVLDDLLIKNPGALSAINNSDQYQHYSTIYDIFL